MNRFRSALATGLALALCSASGSAQVVMERMDLSVVQRLKDEEMNRSKLDDLASCIQDPIEYGTRTHHSNLDTYERLVIDDLKQAAT